MREPLLSVSNVTKRYGGVLALNRLSLDIRAGEVTAILGENGAGKSTLMKVLAGAVRPDEGSYSIRGEKAHLHSVRDANREGIAIVFQELSLYPELDVLANLFLPHPPHTRWRMFDRAAAAAKARPVLVSIGLNVAVDARVGALSLGDRQLVEIARGLLVDAEVLILDEPNSALNAVETERLFRVIDRLRGEGHSIVYVSHRLEEVMAIADRLIVMRDGSVVGDTTPRETDIPTLIHLMVGRPLDIGTVLSNDSLASDETAPRLSFDVVEVAGILGPTTFTARCGEVVGLAGLAGAGPAAVFDVLFGRRHPTSGTVTMLDGGKSPTSVPQAVRRSVALVPSDRRKAGVMLERSIMDNIAQVHAVALGRMGRMLRPKQLEQTARRRMEELAVKASGPTADVGTLSGGNQQKVVLAKWLEAEPSLMLLDDPTRGVDVGAKYEIYRLVRQLAQQGKCVLFKSSELLDYELSCDRVVVFHNRAACLELTGRAISERSILEGINTGKVTSDG